MVAKKKTTTSAKKKPIDDKDVAEKAKKKTLSSVTDKPKKEKEAEKVVKVKKKTLKTEEVSTPSTAPISAPVPAAPLKPTPPPLAEPIKPAVVAKPNIKPIEVSKDKPIVKKEERKAPEIPRPQVEIKKPETISSPMAPAATKESFQKTSSSVPAAVSSSTPVSDRKKIPFNEMMTVKDLAAAMVVKIPDVIKKLLSLGTPASINQRIEFDTAVMLADAFGFDMELKSIYVDEVKELEDPVENLRPRPPVVTVMGHVDHGKTSLLDAIRTTSVVKSESGGITQHIGAYQVKFSKGSITFLDTPGHEAFTAMRARGALVTDIVVLVVAADDSVMPQTIEAIDHAKAANVPIVVAINKVDLPTANVQKVKQELSQYNLIAEDWGGKTVMVEVSARTGHNIDKLLEMILLEAELLELKANPDRPAKGAVLEAHLDQRRGIVATVLSQAGTLRVGDVVVCGLSYGRVRAMLDDDWKPIETAGPSVPVRVLGLTQVPQVGDQLAVVAHERDAREIADRRRIFMKEASAQKKVHISLETLHSKIAEGKIQELPIIIKTDVQGSLQAIQDSLGKIAGGPIQLRSVHTGVGNINESDVLLAEASDAIIFGFHVKIEPSAEAEAKKSGVDIRTYQIIYEMLADIKAAMEGLLKPIEIEVVKARAQVKDTFPSRQGLVAGVIILEGKVNRGAKARVNRQGEIVGNGTISSLRRFKEDVREVEKGYECGLSVEGIKAFNKGDIIEIIAIEKQARRLEVQ